MVFRAALIPLTVLLFYVGVEAAYRLHLFGIDSIVEYWKYGPSGVRHVETPDLDAARGIGGLQPNVVAYFKGAPYETNDLGLRGPEVELVKPAGSFRIVLVGRSATMGAGVPEDLTFARLLEDKLIGTGLDCVEVLNLGVPGETLFRTYLYSYETRAVAFDPDIVLNIIFPIDIGRQKFWATGDSAERLQPAATADFIYEKTLADRLEEDFFFQAALNNLYRERLFGFRNSSWTNDREREKGNRPTPDEKSVEEGMVRLAERIVADGRQPLFAVLLWPTKPKVSKKDWARIETIRAKVAKVSPAAMLDTPRRLDGKLRRSNTIYYGDNHPDRQAHALYADALYGAIMENPDLTIRCPND